MKIAVFGNGGRETAIIQALNPEKNEILTIAEKPFNPQIFKMSHLSIVWNSRSASHGILIKLLKEEGIEMAIIGSESFLPMVNLLQKAGIETVGPQYPASEIELDKAWAVRLMQEAGIPIPESMVFRGTESILQTRALIKKWKKVAIKPAKPSGGKGVKVSGDQLPTTTSAINYALSLLKNGQTIVIQKMLDGIEFSLQAFVDRDGHMVFVPVVHDNKRRYEGDNGLYTGSMGSSSDSNGLLPFLRRSDLEKAKEIMKHTVASIKQKTGIGYQGILYGQFMLIDKGIFVIEFNARFGDPEAINILPLLEEDFTEICMAIVRGTLNKMKISFKPKATVIRYLVPDHYPKKSQQAVIEFQKNKIVPDGSVELFLAGVIEGGKENTLITTGSRAIAVRSEGATISDAAAKIDAAIITLFTPQTLKILKQRQDIGTGSQIEALKTRRKSYKI